MRTLWPSGLLAVLLLVGGVEGGFATDFDKLDRELQAIIENRSSKDEMLLQAISRLGKVSETSAFWTRIANDASYSTNHRRRCVFALFRRHGQRCTALRQLAEKLGPAMWLRDADIIEAAPVFGWIPVDVTPEDTVFAIRVLPDEGDDGQRVYIRIKGKISRDSFSRIIRKDSAKSDNDAVVLQYGFTDDFDKWLHQKAAKTKAASQHSTNE